MSLQLSTEKTEWADGLREGVRGGLRLAVSAKPWSAAFFCVLSFALGLFWFVVLITLLAGGASLVIVWIGIPILAVTMLLWIGGARLERRRMAFFFGEIIPAAY